ncbi:XdhC family protein [Sporomusa sphaeroides DSM 2875]|uniref:XdhC family protein n=1 Tax=Sporomusa sphaeroides TaxID=47679 RepID=UPI00202DED4C|nr:XdhC family protein [Sporomusa sphaeroides]MCM0758435.1 XdhC family protein [Sporomusa sphaeroides DSM 2875]
MSFHELQAAIDNGNAADILTVIDSTSGSPSPIGQMIIIQADGMVSGQLETLVMENILHIVQTTVWTKPVTISVEDALGNTYRLFWDRMVKKFSAIVFGGGHISQPLVQILSLMGFEVTVIDDRPEFANTARFPGAYRVICQKFQLVVKGLTVDNETAVIIVTRGHRYDMDCLRSVMGSDARYLGMIGSRKRIREIITLIKEEGAPADLETRLRAPIGLDLKAETPAEIALSIAAEVVSVFRNGSGRPLSEYKEAF